MPFIADYVICEKCNINLIPLKSVDRIDLVYVHTRSHITEELCEHSGKVFFKMRNGQFQEVT